jgi:hypothetical protein
MNFIGRLGEKMKNLEGRNIYVVGTGARKISQLPIAIKEFIAEGARVYTMMTNMGMELLDSDHHQLNIQGNKVVMGYSSTGEALPLEDLVLVAPCTFNTLNKIANGTADSYPLTIVANALGAQREVVVALAMNKGMWSHPITTESIKKLEKWGCKVIWPEITPEKVTMAPIEKIADTVFHTLAGTRYEDENQPKKGFFDQLREKHYTEFRNIGQEMLDLDLTRGTGGCLSKSVEQGILITASGAQVGSLSKEDISLITGVKDRKVSWMGERKPSSESPLLFEIYSHDPKMGALVHSHSPRITYDPSLQRYATSEYVRAGCFGYGEKVLKLLQDNEGFAILKLHGEITLGSSLKDTYEKLKKKMGEAHER